MTEYKFATVLLFASLHSFAQKDTYHTKINKAEKVIIYNNVNESNKDKVLLINKYLDTTKKMLWHVGGYTSEFRTDSIKADPINARGEHIFDLRVVKGQ